MTVLDTSSNGPAPLKGLRLLQSKVQTGSRRRELLRQERELAAKKQELTAVEAEAEPANPAEPEQSQPQPQSKGKSALKRHKTREFFKWLFMPEVPTTRKTQPAPKKPRVKIPVAYRNGEHEGVLVSGLRVPFSRAMQANRREKLLLENEGGRGIPEHGEALFGFPGRLEHEEYMQEQERLRLLRKKPEDEARDSGMAGNADADADATQTA